MAIERFITQRDYRGDTIERIEDRNTFHPLYCDNPQVSSHVTWRVGITTSPV